MGQIKTVTDACGNSQCSDMVGTNHTMTYSYDQLERLSTVVDPSGVTTKFLYDNNGNTTDEIEAYGSTSLQRTTHYDYDNLNRVMKITYPDTTTKQLTYDFRGNKLTEIDQLGHVTKYAYDLAGQLTSVTYAYGTADAGTVSYSYYPDGRQSTVTDETNQGTNNHTTNTYDPAGRRSTLTLPNGITTSYSYDNASQLTGLSYQLGATKLGDLVYEFDLAGRRWSTSGGFASLTP